MNHFCARDRGDNWEQQATGQLSLLVIGCLGWRNRVLATYNTPPNRTDAPGEERRNDHGDFLERVTERSPPSCVSHCYQ